MNPQAQVQKQPQTQPQTQTRKIQLQPAAGPRFRGRRVTFMYPVQVQLLDGASPPIRAEATNLSLGGMFIHAQQRLAPGSRVKLALEVRGRALAFAEAEVRWVRGSAFSSYPWCPGFGVRFLSLPPRSLALVHHLVTTASQRSARGSGAAAVEQVEPPPAPPLVPQLPTILDLDAPLEQKDFGTKLMYPLSPAAPATPAPLSPAAEAPRPFSAFAPRRKGWGGWRWLRWGLAIAAALGWIAAFSQVRSAEPPPPSTTAQVGHPAGAPR